MEIAKHPERKLLLCCARARMDEATKLRIRSLIAKDIDWDYLLRLAARLRMKPLLHWNLTRISHQPSTTTADMAPPAFRQLADSVGRPRSQALRDLGHFTTKARERSGSQCVPADTIPADIREHLKAAFQSNAERNLAFTVALVRLITLFDDHDIPTIAFKGPVSAHALYGNLSLRQFTDMDIIVHESDVSSTRDLLMANKLNPSVFLRGAQEKALVRYRNELSFVSMNGALAIDLHWRLLIDCYSFEQDQESLWERSVLLNLQGRMVKTLSAEDHLLYLFVRAAIDCWGSLFRICDIAEAVRGIPTGSWEMIMEKAQAAGMTRIASVGLFLAGDLLQAPIPEDIKHEVHTSAIVRAIAERAQRDFLWRERGDVGFVEMKISYLKSLERLRNRARVALFLPFSPGPYDIKLLRLPEPLFPLYRVVRLVRASLKFLQYLWHSARQKKAR